MATPKTHPIVPELEGWPLKETRLAWKLLNRKAQSRDGSEEESLFSTFSLGIPRAIHFAGSTVHVGLPGGLTSYLAMHDS
jgi:phosphoenolpyruvate carboxylase